MMGLVSRAGVAVGCVWFAALTAGCAAQHYRAPDPVPVAPSAARAGSADEGLRVPFSGANQPADEDSTNVTQLSGPAPPVRLLDGETGAGTVPVRDAVSTRGIVFDFTEPPEPVRSFFLSRPPRIVIDVHKPSLGEPRVTRVPGDDRLVAGVRTGRHPDRMRLVLDLKAELAHGHSVRANGHTLTVYLGDLADADPTTPAEGETPPRAEDPSAPRSSADTACGGRATDPATRMRVPDGDAPVEEHLETARECSLESVSAATPDTYNPQARSHSTETLANPTVSPLPQQLAPPVVTAGDRERLRRVAAARLAQHAREDYVIGPDDLLEVTIPDLSESTRASSLRSASLGGAIAREPTLGQGVRVSARGAVTLPLLGSVRAAGYTPRALEEAIARLAVERRLLRRPDVRVSVLEYRSRYASVLGSVVQPGRYPLTGPEVTLSSMLTAAGGPTPEAGRIIEFVPAGTSVSASENGARGGAGFQDPIRIELDTLMQHDIAGTNDPLVHDGDVINVLAAGRVNVDGWIARPGSQDISRALTVAGTIAAAGGPLFPANLETVEVLRILGPGEQTRFMVDIASVHAGEAEDVPVQDGDLIRVPAKRLRLVPWGIWNMARAMLHIGGSVVLF